MKYLWAPGRQENFSNGKSYVHSWDISVVTVSKMFRPQTFVVSGSDVCVNVCGCRRGCGVCSCIPKSISSRFISNRTSEQVISILFY